MFLLYLIMGGMLPEVQEAVLVLRAEVAVEVKINFKDDLHRSQ